MAQKALVCMILLLLPLTLSADINAVLDEIYNAEEAPLLESTWLILVGAEQLTEESAPSEAQSILDRHGWTGEYMTRGQLSLLIMENFELPQGLMFRLTASQRYALKDLLYLNILSGKSHINKGITGYELVTSISTVVEGEEQ